MRHQTFAMLAVGGTLLLVLAPVGPAAAQVACGDTITEDTVLDEDLDCSGAGTNPALTVMGPATLDLNGHLLTCSSGSFIGEGVRLEGARARLVDGSVTGCSGNSRIGFAVVLAGDGSHTVRDLTLTGNSIGVDVRGTDNTGNRIERNSIEPMNVGLATGIQVSGLDTRVSGNHVDGAERGIDLVSGSSSTTVIDNVVTGSTEGIHVNSSENTIQHNELSGNNTGIRLIGVIPAAPGGALSNVIAGNQATGNGTDLIDENPGCDDNDWHGNIFDTADPEDCID